MIPHHRIWLILLAVFLSFSSGFRMMDYVVCTNYFSEEAVFDNQGMYLISAALTPFFVVPWMGFWCLRLLRHYPAQPISLFYWFPGKWVGQVFGIMFFGFFILERLLLSFDFAYYSGQFFGMGDDELGFDAACNTLAALGAAYLWACMRALNCHRLATPSHMPWTEGNAG